MILSLSSKWRRCRDGLATKRTAITRSVKNQRRDDTLVAAIPGAYLSNQKRILRIKDC